MKGSNEDYFKTFPNLLKAITCRLLTKMAQSEVSLHQYGKTNCSRFLACYMYVKGQ